MAETYWKMEKDSMFATALKCVKILYHSNLNVILVISTTEGSISVYDCTTGSKLRDSKIFDKNMCLDGVYLVTHNKLVLTNGSTLGMRTDYNGILLFDTILQPTVQDQNDVVEIEIPLVEAILFQQALKQIELPNVDCVSDLEKLLNEKINEIGNGYDKNAEAGKWNTICIKFPHCSLKRVVSKMYSELRRQNCYIPALPIASSIHERLNRLFPTFVNETRAHETMFIEANRRETFTKWPHMGYKWALPDRMAQAGFYHLPNTDGDDRVRCFNCVVGLVDWEPTDEPWSEHGRHAPLCSFLREEYTQNVPLSVNYATAPAETLSDHVYFGTSSFSNIMPIFTRKGIVTLYNISRFLKVIFQFYVPSSLIHSNDESLRSKLSSFSKLTNETDVLTDIKVTACSVLTTHLYRKYMSNFKKFIEKTNYVNNNCHAHAALNNSSINSCVVVAMKKNHHGGLEQGKNVQLFLVVYDFHPKDSENNESDHFGAATAMLDEINVVEMDHSQLQNNVETVNIIPSAGSSMISPDGSLVPNDNLSNNVIDSVNTMEYTFTDQINNRSGSASMSKNEKKLLETNEEFVDMDQKIWPVQQIRISVGIDSHVEVMGLHPILDGQHILVILKETEYESTDDEYSGNILLIYKLTVLNSNLLLEEKPVVQRILKKTSEVPKDFVTLPLFWKRDELFLPNGHIPMGVLLTESGELHVINLTNLESQCVFHEDGIKYVSVVYCDHLEKLCVCDEDGKLHYISLIDKNFVFDELPSMDNNKTGNNISTEMPSIKELRNLCQLTHFENAVPCYFTRVPSCWNEIKRAQRQQRHPQRLLHGVDSEQHTRTWKLKTGERTWDEHLFELLLPETTSVGKVDVKFKLKQSREPDIQVTLLCLKDDTLRTIKTETPDTISDYFDGIEGLFSTYDSPPVTSRNPVLLKEYQSENNTDILCGPINMKKYLDLTKRSGTITLTSPKLFRNSCRTLLLHVKALGDGPPENTKIDGKITTKTSETTKKKGQPDVILLHLLSYKDMNKENLFGCDLIKELSITVRKPKHVEMVDEKVTRCVMLENKEFVEDLLYAFCKNNDAEYRLMALDILIWITTIKLCRFRSTDDDVPKKQSDFVHIVKQKLSELVRHGFIEGDRKMAHKVAKLLISCSLGCEDIDDTEVVEYDHKLLKVLIEYIPQTLQCGSAGAFRWFFQILLYVLPYDYAKSSEKCLSLLIRVAKELHSRTDPYHLLLRTRYGLYGNPFEPELFDIDPTVLPNIYNNLGGVAPNIENYPIFSNQSSITPNVLRGFFSLQKPFTNSTKDHDVSKGISASQYMKGLLEVEPLHFMCHSTSIGTRVEVIDCDAVKEDAALVNHYTAVNVAPVAVTNFPYYAPNSVPLSEESFPWQQLLVLPPQHVIMIDKMRSGAKEFVVLDFGFPVCLTDVLIPSCTKLMSLSIDTWCKSEEIDCKRLVVSTDIGSRMLIMSDIQPPPICRYLKITAISRHGMRAEKCKIPIGSFYGHSFVMAKDAYAEDNDIIYARSNSEINLQMLREGIRSRYGLVCSLLREQLIPLMPSEILNEDYMIHYLNKGEMKNMASEEETHRINILYKDCIVYQHQMNLVRNLTNRMQNSCSKSSIVDLNKLLSAACADKLRNLTEVLLDVLLYIFAEWGSHVSPSVINMLNADVCHNLFTWLCVGGDIKTQIATCSLLVHLYGTQPGWGNFLTKSFTNLFSSNHLSIFPQDRVFILLSYLGQSGISLGGNENYIIEHIMKAILQELAPLADTNEHVYIRGKLDLSLLSWLLRFFLQCVEVLPYNKTAQDCKSTNNDSIRWNFIQNKLLEYKPHLKIFGNNASYAAAFGSNSKNSSKNENPPSSVPVNLLSNIGVDKIHCSFLSRALITFMLHIDVTCNIDLFCIACKVMSRLLQISNTAMPLNEMMNNDQLVKLIQMYVLCGGKWASHAICCLLQDIIEKAPENRIDVQAHRKSTPIEVTSTDCNERIPTPLDHTNLYSIYENIELISDESEDISELEDNLDEFLSEYKIAFRERIVNIKNNNSPYTNTSAALDARLEFGMEENVEIFLRSLTDRNSCNLIRNVNTMLTITPTSVSSSSNEIKMDNNAHLWSVPNPTDLSTMHMFSTSFEKLFSNFNILYGNNNNLEELLSLWLQLSCKDNTESTSSASYYNSFGSIFMSPKLIPSIMTGINNRCSPSIRLWFLIFKTLTVCVNTFDKDEQTLKTTNNEYLLQYKDVIKEIVKYPLFSKMLSDFLSNSLVDDMAGENVVYMFTSFLNRLSVLVQSNNFDENLNGTLQEKLLEVLGTLLANVGAIYCRSGPLDAQIAFISLLYEMEFVDVEFLNPIDIVSKLANLKWPYVHVLNSVKCTSSEVPSNPTSVTNSESYDGRTMGPFNREFLVMQLYRFASKLLTLSSKESTSHVPQTDKNKVEQMSTEDSSDEFTSTLIADIVLKKADKVEQFLNALNSCYRSSLQDISELEMIPISKPLTNHSTIADGIMYFLGTLFLKSSDSQQKVKILFEFLFNVTSSYVNSGNSSPQLSGPLLWILMKVLNDVNSISEFIKMRGLDIISQNLCKCFSVILNQNSSFVSTVMQNMYGAHDLDIPSTSTEEEEKNEDRLINFAPLGIIMVDDPAAKPADVLLMPAEPALSYPRKWSYSHPGKESVDLKIILPYAIFLNEIHLRTNNKPSAISPSAISLEISHGGEYISILNSEITSGFKFLRLTLSQPEVVTSVRIKCSKPKDDVIGLSQICLFGDFAFGGKTWTNFFNDIPSHQRLMNTSMSWLNLYNHILNVAKEEPHVESLVLQAMTSNETTSSICGLLLMPTPLPLHFNTILVNILQRWGTQSNDLRLRVIKIVLRHGFANNYKGGKLVDPAITYTVCELLHRLCYVSNKLTVDSVTIMIDWLMEVANASLSSKNTEIPIPSYVYCFACILWSSNKSVYSDGLLQFTPTTYELLFDWSASLPMMSPLKLAVDRVLCSLYAIQPANYISLLEKMSIIYRLPNNNFSEKNISDDFKEEQRHKFIHINPYNQPIVLPNSMILLSSKYLMMSKKMFKSLSNISQSHISAHQLIGSGFLALLVDVIIEFCQQPKIEDNEYDVNKFKVTFEMKKYPTADDKLPMLHMDTITNILNFFSEMCWEGSIRTWLGSSEICVFWEALLHYLCETSSFSHIVKNELPYESLLRLEDATIMFLSRCCWCYPKNQKTLARIIYGVIDKYPKSCFPRRILLQLVLETEKTYVLVESNMSTTTNMDHKVNTRHRILLPPFSAYSSSNQSQLLYISSSLMCTDILQLILDGYKDIAADTVIQGDDDDIIMDDYCDEITIAAGVSSKRKRRKDDSVSFSEEASKQNKKFCDWNSDEPKRKRRKDDSVSFSEEASKQNKKICDRNSDEHMPTTIAADTVIQGDDDDIIMDDYCDEITLAAGVSSKGKRMKDETVSCEEASKQYQKFSDCNSDEPRTLSSNDITHSNPNLMLWLPTESRYVNICQTLTMSQILQILHDGGDTLETPIIKFLLVEKKEEAVTDDEKPKNLPENLTYSESTSVLKKFVDIRGLEIVAHRLPKVYPTNRYGQGWVKVVVNAFEDLMDKENMASPPLAGGSSSLPEKRNTHLIPPHSLIAFVEFLKWPNYAKPLIRNQKQAQCLLRFVLGNVEETYFNFVGNSPISAITPFEILKCIFKETSISTEHGSHLRTLALQYGVLHIILAYLAVFSHQPESISLTDDPENQHMPLMIALKQCSSEDESQQYWAKRTGFGTGSMTQIWNVEKTLYRLRIEEELVTIFLEILSCYINPDSRLQDEPTRYLDEEFNSTSSLPESSPLPSSFVQLIGQSCLLSALASYLKNDSVSVMARCIPLYRASLSLVRAMAVHPQLVNFLLPDTCFADSQPGPSTKQGQTDKEQIPFIDLFKNLKQCVDTYTSRLEKIKGSNISNEPKQVSVEEEDEDGEGLEKLILDITSTTGIIEVIAEKTMPKDNLLSVELASISQMMSVTVKEVYKCVMKTLQFDSYDMYVEDPDGLGCKFTVTYHFDANMDADGDKYYPARMKRLAQEAKTTSLPLSYSSSVFVRYDTDRLDMMKVLITGPSDTPYANGCFEFDVYFPPDYPNKPMLINLVTTGRRSVQFNPNLYTDGKVGLSVLNTWEGKPEEGWNAQTSSLLQVLVSIQSLILVPEPYFNEPGFERSRGTRTGPGDQRSREYNANIMQATVKWAMLDQIRNPSLCFKEIIHTHFWLKKNEVTKQIQNWIKEIENDIGDNTSLKSDFKMLCDQLAKLTVPECVKECSKYPQFQYITPNVSPTASDDKLVLDPLVSTEENNHLKHC